MCGTCTSAGPLLTAGSAGREILIIGFGFRLRGPPIRPVFPDSRVTGIELDPAMIETGETVLSPDIAKANVITGDGRQALYGLDTRI